MDNDTLNSLTLNCVAVPHDETRRLVLADAAAENGDPLVADALRNKKRGPGIPRRTYELSQERQCEPDYRLLWAVVVTDLDRTPEAKSNKAAVVPPDFQVQLERMQEIMRQARQARRRGGTPAQTPDRTPDRATADDERSWPFDLPAGRPLWSAADVATAVTSVNNFREEAAKMRALLGGS